MRFAFNVTQRTSMSRNIIMYSEIEIVSRQVVSTFEGQPEGRVRSLPASLTVTRMLLLLLVLLLLFNLLKNTEHAYNNNELSIRESSLHNSLTLRIISQQLMKVI